MFCAPCESPLSFCFNCMCAPCGAYVQREKLLGDSPYYCCMGNFPFLCLANPCDKVPWLCCEVLCCTVCAVTANRAYIQRTKGVMNSGCDDCLIWTTCICQWTVCLCDTFGYQCPPAIENAVDCFYYLVIGCMLTQQEIEIDENFTAPPPKQQTMRA